MRVLLASQYFEPEVGATQNRMSAFAQALRARGHDVIVICEQPNHPNGVFEPGYGRRLIVRERADRWEANRLWVYTSPQKTTFRRLLFYGTFGVGGLIAAATIARPDVAFITSPPLPGALAIAAALRARRVPFVLDVRDLWPAAAEALGELSNRRVLAAFERAERWLYRSAVAVTATTEPFCRHIDAVAKRAVAVHVPNGALDELVSLEHRDPPASRPLRIGYFGNFGIAQGLDIALDAAAALRDEPVEFVLTGAGPEEDRLRQRVVAEQLSNVQLRPAVAPSAVGDLMLDCHSLLVPLRDHALLADFIPSKVYDAIAVGRPVIVAARGEAAQFVAANRVGLEVSPERGDELAAAVRRLLGEPELARQLGATGKALAAEHSRSRSAERVCALLEDVVAGSGHVGVKGGAGPSRA